MRTARAKPAARIVVQPPKVGIAPLFPSASLSDMEAWAIAKAISPRFADYRNQYDTVKFPPEVYDRVCHEFRKPASVSPKTLRDAILWKFGHRGKLRIPPAHERLIAELQKGWQAAAATLPIAPDEAFRVLNREFGSKTRFITVAFLLHLLHPVKVPIIDQHNFRAINSLMSELRPGWHSKKKPSQYEDLKLVAAFMKAVLTAWRHHAPNSVKTARELDMFLMMYGKAIKGSA